VVIALDPVQSLLAAVLVLFLGAGATAVIKVLGQYNIPHPITGGVLFAGAAALLKWAGGIEIALEATVKPVLLLLFFAAIGLTADLRLLGKGGPKLLIFCAVLLPFLLVQNLTGVGMALVLDLHPILGLVAGTITQIGGHGTGAAYAERFADVNNIQGVMELSMTAATIGLVLGGVVGGPVAQSVIRRFDLKSTATAEDAGVAMDGSAKSLTSTAMLATLGAALFAVIVGEALARAIGEGVITLPSFLWCLLTGVVVRNLGGLGGLKLDDRATDMLGSICLSLFLALTMMALKLSDVVNFAGPILAILAVQVTVVVLYTRFIVFRLIGRDYEAAVMSAGFIGFAMGATATAIANMQALTKRYGPAPQAFLIVPLVGAFLIDLMNAIVLTGFLSLRLLGG